MISMANNTAHHFKRPYSSRPPNIPMLTGLTGAGGAENGSNIVRQSGIAFFELQMAFGFGRFGQFFVHT